jgi:hypothetical protein
MDPTTEPRDPLDGGPLNVRAWNECQFYGHRYIYPGSGQGCVYCGERQPDADQ